MTNEMTTMVIRKGHKTIEQEGNTKNLWLRTLTVIDFFKVVGVETRKFRKKTREITTLTDGKNTIEIMVVGNHKEMIENI